MKKLISIDIFADFGMLKKPDTNEPVYLTFNMMHKPALLGILGAIIGESGFNEKGILPDYYLKLNDLKVGIQPINHEKGNYQKTVITYNNTTGMASKEQGGNLMVTEQTLIAPAYRCYFLFDMDNKTHQKADENLSKYYAEYLPYLGKNEFSVWWENYMVYKDFSEFEPIGIFKIKSIFIKDVPLKDSKDKDALLFDPVFEDAPEGFTFSYFERLPIGYMDIGKNNYQYEYRNFAFTDWSLKMNNESSNLLLKTKENGIIQVF
jgi:CRISPR-associated protein Cas5h